ncbi:Hypothetical predicted protein [Scomber scombrus]|uniref:Uncharacterized protein n=1 Tax=Scomber scombrus TaxID=13677 RepID=A0AAV1QDS3_SCOSC
MSRAGSQLVIYRYSRVISARLFAQRLLGKASSSVSRRGYKQLNTASSRTDVTSCDPELHETTDGTGT